MVLSVLIITYNQDNYIAQAIDSILIQKTTFTFEMILKKITTIKIKLK